MSDRPAPGHDEETNADVASRASFYEQPPAAGACGPSPDVEALREALSDLVSYAENLPLTDVSPRWLRDHQEDWRANIKKAREVLTATEPKAAGAEGEVPKKEGAVDWRVRSQGLEEALRGLQRYACTFGGGMMVPFASGDWVRFNCVLACLSLGLPDEEGEGAICNNCVDRPADRDTEEWGPLCRHCHELLSDHGAAPPPRGPSAQGPEAEAVQTIEAMRANVWPAISAHSMPEVAQLIEGWADDFEGYLRRAVEARAAVVVRYEHTIGQLRAEIRAVNGTLDRLGRVRSEPESEAPREPEPKAEAPKQRLRRFKNDPLGPVRDVSGEGER